MQPLRPKPSLTLPRKAWARWMLSFLWLVVHCAPTTASHGQPGCEAEHGGTQSPPGFELHLPPQVGLLTSRSKLPLIMLRSSPQSIGLAWCPACPSPRRDESGFLCKAGDSSPGMCLLKSCLVTSFSDHCLIAFQTGSEEMVTHRQNACAC